MKQLDFTDCGQIRTAEMQKRHDAFWGPLDEARRTATRVACDFFAFADEVQWQMCLHRHHAKDDAEKSKEAFIRAQMFARCALGKFRLFCMVLGCRDDAEGIHRLDRIVEYSRKCQWVIFPAWWTRRPDKNTAYFIGQFKIHAGQYTEYLAKRREEAEKKAEAKAKQKGGAK